MGMKNYTYIVIGVLGGLALAFFACGGPATAKAVNAELNRPVMTMEQIAEQASR
jgi:hypothetical protein